MGFVTDVGYPGRDNPDRIPEVSLMYRDGGDVVRLQNIMLPDVDKEIQERELAEKDALYRVDYLWEGKTRRAMGRLEAGDGVAAFLERVGGSTASRGVVETQILCGLLKKHLALCRLESLAREEISLQGNGEEMGIGSAGEDIQYQQANAAYYREVLIYAGKARCILNMQPCPVLPPFPERRLFLAEWYRNHKDSKGGRQNED